VSQIDVYENMNVNRYSINRCHPNIQLKQFASVYFKTDSAKL